MALVLGAAAALEGWRSRRLMRREDAEFARLKLLRRDLGLDP